MHYYMIGALVIFLLVLQASAETSTMQMVHENTQHLDNAFGAFTATPGSTGNTWEETAHSFYDTTSDISASICYAGKVLQKGKHFLAKEFLFLPGCVTPAHTHKANCSFQNIGKGNIINLVFKFSGPDNMCNSIGIPRTNTDSTIVISAIEVLMPHNITVDRNPGDDGHVIINPDPNMTASTRHLYGTGNESQVNDKFFLQTEHFIDVMTGIIMDYQRALRDYTPSDTAIHLTEIYKDIPIYVKLLH